jgi:hypothetical protein
MRDFKIIFISIFLSGCATSSKDLYDQLATKTLDQCISKISDLAVHPADKFGTGKTVKGELDDKQCLILPDGSRSSFLIYEFVADSQSHSINVITHIKARGLGFGGENTIVIPVITILSEGIPVPDSVKTFKPKWVRDAWSGDYLLSLFSLTHLNQHKSYRLLLTTNNKLLGKELSGYYSTVASGIVVIGPMGKSELTLN